MDDFLTRYAIGGATRPDAISGMNPQFRQGLTSMFMNAPADIQNQMHLFSGYRSPEVQAVLYQNALKKYGTPEIARKWVAPPGHSEHNRGDASDIQFGNDAARQWAHAHAADYGLAFPLSNEAWHVELAGARGQQPPAAPQQVTQSPPAQPSSLASLYAQPPAAQPEQAIVPPVDTSMGGLAAMFLQNQAARRQQRDDQQQADQARRAALLGTMNPFS